MITEQEYKEASAAKDKAVKVMAGYLREREAEFAKRMEDNPVFTEGELVYAAYIRCPCGHGMAYPKACGANHYWDCAAILKGIGESGVRHGARLPFASCKVMSEDQRRANGATTRGSVRAR